MRFDQRNVVIAFEGMDAAGKGGAIKRIVKNLDPREYDIHCIGAPERFGSTSSILMALLEPH